jgi:hypothetical protein
MRIHIERVGLYARALSYLRCSVRLMDINILVRPVFERQRAQSIDIPNPNINHALCVPMVWWNNLRHAPRPPKSQPSSSSSLQPQGPTIYMVVYHHPNGSVLCLSLLSACLTMVLVASIEPYRYSYVLL